MINRNLNIIDKLDDNKSFFLFGPRGVGKSRLIKDALASSKARFLLIDLLRTSEFRAFLKDPGLLYEQIAHQIKSKSKLLVFIDEIQKIPELLDEVHRAIEDFGRNVQFILTGSSARKLKRSGANLLGGRAAVYNLYPFTTDEIAADLSTFLQFGSLPLIHAIKNPISTLKSYVDTYLTNEIQQEALVRKLEPFTRFIELAAQFNGKQINYSKTAKQVGATTKTVIEYFAILVDTLIVARIEPWSYSVVQQLAQSPRYYFFDCGVLNALSGELKTELRPGTARYGNLFETFIINELIRMNEYEELENKFFYMRLHSGLEVDLIISRGPRDRPRCIEIKSKTSPDKSDLEHLIKSKELIAGAQLFCLCDTPRPYTVEGVKVLPWRDGLKEVLK